MKIFNVCCDAPKSVVEPAYDLYFPLGMCCSPYNISEFISLLIGQIFNIKLQMNSVQCDGNKKKNKTILIFSFSMLSGQHRTVIATTAAAARIVNRQ